MTRAGQLADAQKCLTQARRNLASVRKSTDGDTSPLAASRVHRAEQAVAAWQADVSRLSALLVRK